MEEVSEIYVIMRGEVKIGFRINQKQSYALKGDDMLFGAYNITFNKRSMFVFRISNQFKERNGYFIRKKNWMFLIRELPKEHKKIEELVEKLKDKIDFEYYSKLMNPMIYRKNKAMERFTLRNDYE